MPDDDRAAEAEFGARLRRQAGRARYTLGDPTDGQADPALAAAMAELDAARAARDDLRVDQAERRLDAVVDAARTAAAPAPQPAPDFGAGARPTRREPEDMSAVLRRAAGR